MHIHIYIHIYVYTCAHTTYIHIHMYTHNTNMYMNRYINTYIYVEIYIYIYIYVHTYMNVFVACGMAIYGALISPVACHLLPPCECCLLRYGHIRNLAKTRPPNPAASEMRPQAENITEDALLFVLGAN